MAKAKTKSRRLNISPWFIVAIVVGLAALAFVMLYRLGSIMPGLSPGESSFYGLKLGWHGLYHNPLNLPLNLLWSVDFRYLAPVGQTLLRLPAAITGALSVVAFYTLLQLWYSLRTAIIGSLLFACSAWTLHVSRLANLNVEYLAAVTIFFLSTAILQKRLESRYVYWLINLTWGLILYVPGMVFLVGYNLYRQREEVGFGAKIQSGLSSKLAYVFSALIWIPLLLHYFIKTPKNILLWLGLPLKYDSPLHILKEFLSVYYHIFIHGPLLPDLWLGRLPLLDIFSIIAALTGIYFYATHYKATRTHLLLASLLIGSVLIALGGSVPLSIVMPTIYILIAGGVAYLLSQWLSVFPENPIARSVGYGLISLAIAASCLYNLRAYFIAWPHNDQSVSVFDVKPKD